MKKAFFMAMCALASFCLCLCGSSLAAPAGQNAGSGSEQKTAAPVNGRVYAKQKGDAYMAAFTGVYRCIVSKTSVYKGETKFEMNPKDLYLCAAPLQQFREARIQLDFGPPLVFESEKEEQAIRADAALIDGLHQHICGIFNQIVSIRHTKTQADILAYQRLCTWADTVALKSLRQLNDLDKLLKKYAGLKSRGRMVSSPFPHFEASDSVLKEMEAVVTRLGDYIAFNVDTRHLRPADKGLFLVDFDRHSTRYFKNVGDSIRRLEGLAGKFKADEKWLIDHGINDLRQLKTSGVFVNFEALPEAMLHDICGRSIQVFERIVEILKAMRDGKGNFTPTPYLSQDVLKGTIFSPNAEHSYLKSVRDAVAPLMLNTRDKHNRELKHSI